MKRLCVAWARGKRYVSSQLKLKLSLFAVTLFLSLYKAAAQGVEGITAAETTVKSYFPKAIDLMYAIGAVMGIIGAVKVYNKWNSGDQDTSKVAASWFGSCVFLVVVATVLKAFFKI